MKQDQKSQLITYFADPLLLNYILEFLNIKEQLKITTLNKQLRYIMQNYFSNLLQDHKLHIIPNKSKIHQMHFYFGRCLRIFKNVKQIDVVKEQNKQGKRRKQSIEQDLSYQSIFKHVIQNPFKFTVITSFQVGPIYTYFLNNEHKAFIFRTNQLLSLIDTKQKPIFSIEYQVKQVKCKGQRLIILKSSGQIFVWQTEKKSIILQTIIMKVHWTVNIPVKHIYSSYNYNIFILQNPHSSKYLLLSYIFGYDAEIDENQADKKEDHYYCVAFNCQNQIYYLVKINALSLITVAIGSKQAYFLNQKNQCMFVEFQNVNQGTKELKAKKFEGLAQKCIIKIVSGYTFFVALQRNIEDIQEWTTQKILVWLKDIGFGDYIKIAKAQKINGKILKNIERNYMQKVLGINKLNMQQKLILCIDEIIEGKGKHQNDQVWVWGRNEFGQLGASHANYIAQPLKLKMDFIKGNDRVDSIFCGWYQTFIRTHRGKIYQTIIRTEKKKKKIIQQKQDVFSDEQQLKKQIQEGFKYKNKKKKKSQDHKIGQQVKNINKRHKKFQEQQKWIESKAGKAFFISSYKEYVFYIQCPDQNKFEPTKQKKLRTSKAIIDRILWDDSLDKSQFKIGIIDKDMGTIQINLYQITMFDYKQTSIRYVKRNNNIVWDREHKIDHL